MAVYVSHLTFLLHLHVRPVVLVSHVKNLFDFNFNCIWLKVGRSRQYRCCARPVKDFLLVSHSNCPRPGELS